MWWPWFHESSSISYPDHQEVALNGTILWSSIITCVSLALPGPPACLTVYVSWDSTKNRTIPPNSSDFSKRNFHLGSMSTAFIISAEQNPTAARVFAKCSLVASLPPVHRCQVGVYFCMLKSALPWSSTPLVDHPLQNPLPTWENVFMLSCSAGQVVPFCSPLTWFYSSSALRWPSLHKKVLDFDRVLTEPPLVSLSVSNSLHALFSRNGQ